LFDHPASVAVLAELSLQRRKEKRKKLIRKKRRGKMESQDYGTNSLCCCCTEVVRPALSVLISRPSNLARNYKYGKVAKLRKNMAWRGVAWRGMAWHGNATSGVQSGLELQGFIRKLDSVLKKFNEANFHAPGQPREVGRHADSTVIGGHVNHDFIHIDVPVVSKLAHVS
jgi:hypothetical protein